MYGFIAGHVLKHGSLSNLKNNMRTIKFRAWNSKNSNPKERMINNVYISNDGRVVMTDGAEWDIPVMQFTGLLDKNGKDIYEGDIVKDLDNNLVSVIEWERAGFMQKIKIAYERLNGRDYRKPEYEEGITGLCDGKGLEIIGNIYENPELLAKE